MALHIKPLLPRHGINLIVWDSEHTADGVRFVRLFRETWSTLPLYVRRKILKHWRDAELPSPHIELADMKRKFVTGAFTSCGLTITPGHQIFFWSPAFDVLPDQRVPFGRNAQVLIMYYPHRKGVRWTS